MTSPQHAPQDDLVERAERAIWLAQGALSETAKRITALQADLAVAVEALERIGAYRVVTASANVWTAANACRAIADQALSKIRGQS